MSTLCWRKRHNTGTKQANTMNRKAKVMVEVRVRIAVEGLGSVDDKGKDMG
jgi:hypothetical protein